MANYKVVDVDQLNADLTSIANSIRAKAGVTEKLDFPDGFKSAVDVIQSGGGTIPDNARLYYVGNAVGTLNLSIFNSTTNVVGVLT